MKRLISLVREPLVHFLLIGAGLFLLFNVTSGPAGDQPDRIVVTSGQVKEMEAKFTRTWMRPPTKEELAGLIETYVRDEIYYREAVAMGLDRNDPTIRQRMRLKLEFLLEDLSTVAEPGDDVLTAYLQENPDQFRVEARVSFRQVYLNPAKRQDMETDARSALSLLKRGAAPESVGDSTLMQGEYRMATRSDIAGQFGEPFARQVVALAPGAWTGPHYSGLGGHLVKVTEHQEGRLPALAEIAAYRRATTVEKLGARVGKVLAKYKMGKFIHWSIDADQNKVTSREHRLIWSLDADKVAQEQRFDGCYIINSDVDKEQMDTLEVVNAYKSLTFVERAFRNLKTVQLEIRPVYHKHDERIRSHVFLCMLAYYLQWHMEQRLAPLFANDGQGQDRRWTFRGVIDCLTQITRNRVTVNGAEFYQNSTPTQEQEQILDLLQLSM